MSTSLVEAFLARIYVDPEARARFVDNPVAEALKAGLSPHEIEAVQRIDRVGLELFATSLERKRQCQHAKRSWMTSLLNKSKVLILDRNRGTPARFWSCRTNQEHDLDVS